MLTIQLFIGGCELIADFDSGEREKLTVKPTPIPSLDGSMPIRGDGSVGDAAVVIGADGGVMSTSLRLGMDAGNESRGRADRS